MPNRIPFTRFQSKLANYEGWALFCDSDIVFLRDVKELFDQADDKYAVMCVQHDYTSKLNQNGRTKANFVSQEKLESQWCCIIAVIPMNEKLSVDSSTIPTMTVHIFTDLLGSKTKK